MSGKHGKPDWRALGIFTWDAEGVHGFYYVMWVSERRCMCQSVSKNILCLIFETYD